MLTRDICVYCEEVKPVTLHNDELVCYDCRVEFLDQEFADPSERRSEIPAELKDIIEHGVLF